MKYKDFLLINWSNTPVTYIALRFIAVSTNGNRAPLHESHDPLKVPLVDNTSVVLKGLWVVGVKLLQCGKHRMNDCQIA